QRQDEPLAASARGPMTQDRASLAHAGQCLHVDDTHASRHVPRSAATARSHLPPTLLARHDPEIEPCPCDARLLLVAFGGGQCSAVGTLCPGKLSPLQGDVSQAKQAEGWPAIVIAHLFGDCPAILVVLLGAGQIAPRQGCMPEHEVGVM